ncbi:unnamed protein product [Blepharisma stoltei]|uniref:Uncharacterized protein n=1 Tax=Blepharisma stoltei TaxID=1481888 RepID=A0AAU9J7F7_9CILI|nr:unnamed protein product [Blepharisma stoltei]
METNGHLHSSHTEHSMLMQINSLPLHPMLITNDEACEKTFESYLIQLESYLKVILEQGKKINEDLDETITQLQNANPHGTTLQDESKTDIEIVKSLRSSFISVPEPPFSIKLSSAIGQVIYKNKPFSLKLKISSQNSCELGKVSLKIKVYTYELPPKEILFSTKGEAILVNARTKELDSPKSIKFKRVSFTEVSSRYPGKKVIMLILADGRSDITPLIIEGIQVKSRMPNQLAA